MESSLALEVAAFLLGLLFGSFLNVIISRVPRHESISRPRSHCPNCNAPIRWFDNVPILSWVLLRGRCRSCQEVISWRYPAVELATGIWFAVCAGLLSADSAHSSHSSKAQGHVGSPFSPGLSLDLPVVLACLSIGLLGFFLIALIVIDWQTQTLPDALTSGGILASFLLTSAQAIFLGPEQDVHLHRRNPLTSPGAVIDRGNLLLTGPEALLGQWLLSMLAAAALLLLIRWLYRALRHREGMGLGDVKLMALIAAFLGFWPAILALFTGVLLATVYAAGLLARRRADALTRLPFGSFLAAGGLLSAVAGPQIIGWYKSLL